MKPTFTLDDLTAMLSQIMATERAMAGIVTNDPANANAASNNAAAAPTAAPTAAANNNGSNNNAGAPAAPAPAAAGNTGAAAPSPPALAAPAGLAALAVGGSGGGGVVHPPTQGAAPGKGKEPDASSRAAGAICCPNCKTLLSLTLAAVASSGGPYYAVTIGREVGVFTDWFGRRP
ncbi:hypothetical protein ONZ45_g9099 [Pleurotus djamor]|nr:hypothetical protein ONZ45_g9099 [Pleurotus djamor]